MAIKQHPYVTEISYGRQKDKEDTKGMYSVSVKGGPSHRGGNGLVTGEEKGAVERR